MTVRVERPAEGVALVVLDRPERRNALDFAAFSELTGALGRLAAEPDLRCLVLTGAPPAFCAGGDLETIAALGAMEHTKARAAIAEGARSAVLLHELPVPTIAAVGGPAVGAGLGLALSCDIVLAGPHATFAAPFLALGAVPDYGCSWLLPRLAGAQAGLELLLTGDALDAHAAVAAGLARRVEDDAVAAALDLAVVIAAADPAVVRATKALVREADAANLAHIATEAEPDAQAEALRARLANA